MLTGKILSTLGKEYDNFKDLWDSIPTTDQKLNLETEKLCVTELRESLTSDHVTSASAYVVREAVEAKDS